MENIDKFNEWAALVLAWLYEKFPTPTSLHHGDLKSSPDPARAERIMRYTVVFLEEEGYLRFGEFKPPGQFSQVKLTGKGLNALNRIPDLKNDKSTVGEILVKKVHAGGKGQYRELIELFMQDVVLPEE